MNASNPVRRWWPVPAVALLGFGAWFLAPRSSSPAGADREEQASTHFADAAADVVPADAVLTLHEQPAASYEAPLTADRADDDFAELARRHGLEYDLHLARAAREYAYQWTVLGNSPPEDAMAFLLRSAGATEDSVAQVALETNSVDSDAVDRALRAALADPPQGQGALRVGIGEVAAEGSSRDRRIAVLVKRKSAVELEAIPRTVAIGGTWPIRGDIPEAVDDLEAVAWMPDQRFVDLEVTRDGKHFAIDVPAGTEPGTLVVALEGSGASGPGKLVQLQAEVGRPLPREFHVHWRSETPFTDPAAAESYVAELIDRDRQAAGLAPLAYDADLAAIARAHSIDMRAHHFFGHFSPTTGMASDRLEAAGYRSARSSENLAFNDSLAEAEASLMSSVGHRRNLLDPEVTRVGVGVAIEKRGDETSYWVTQLFVRPVESLEEDQAIDDIMKKLGDARGEENLPPLAVSDVLEPTAIDGAHRAARGQVEGLADAISEAAEGLAEASIAVSVQRVSLLSQITIPDVALEDQWREVAVAVAQDPGDVHGSIGVVFILTE